METALSTLAQVFVGPLVGTISDHYGPAILEKIGIKWDVNEEMEKLSDILLTIQDVLEDAEDKQTTSKPIRNWLRKLKDIVYDVEDILDECATEALHEPESTGIINEAAMVERIKQLIDKFDKITEQRSKFNLINLNSGTDVKYRVDLRRETSSFPAELKVYGRDKDKKCIVNLLVNNINDEDLSICAIVGIAGLGKTTLAQMVYNDNMVESRFKVKRWVCVSENFELKSLIGDIIQFRSNDVQTLDQLQRRLLEELSGKRFLLVLDDVWNEDQTKWERLKLSLTCGAKGSSIIVTTRSDKVASLMGTLPVCRPNFLSEEDCFSLFKHRAFAEGEEEHHPNLESIGQQIMKKCGGVPLAAKALGGLLRFQREEKEWLFVKESNLWDLPQDKEDSILPALRLSYKHLPQHLRQCFAYCSIFPKDYLMKKEVLIQLWMANGFFQPKGSMELEEIGNGIFNDLLWRSLFQDVEKDIDGNIVACKMHDLVHDLACSITRGECFSVVIAGDKEQLVGRRHTTRHLAIHHNILFSPNFNLPVLQSFLRTLLQLGRWNFDIPIPLNFSNLIHLRALDLSRTVRLETLPESIGRLKLLRYLDISETNIVLLPDVIFCNLRNLQTLKLCRCRKFKMLPTNMSKLTNLRHLDITSSTNKLLQMPVGMGQLKSLHMLSNFIVSEESGCGVGELHELDQLGGTLAITCLRKQRDLIDAKNAKLIRKQNIRYLQLIWSEPNGRMPRTDAMQPRTDAMHHKLIADALQPHPNIVRLDFHYYGGSDFPSWMNSTCLLSLVEISLSGCPMCKHLPALGLLPRLKVLKISSNKSVKCIGNEFYSGEEGSNMISRQGMALFPSLEELEITRMQNLEEWTGWLSSSPSSSRMKEEVQVAVFPVLKRLKIGDCPSLRSFPPLPIQHLELCDCNEKIFERSLEGLPHLSHLCIRDCHRWSPDQGMVGLQNLTALQELKITDCPVLLNLPEGMQSLSDLHLLNIRNCRELGFGLLPHTIENLVSLPFPQLVSLPTVAAVPMFRSTDSTLKIISFSFCPGLTNLSKWITNQGVQALYIHDCFNLKSLPDGLQHLTDLRHLQITECHPELYRRCQKNTGDDWHKIAHIPELIIRLPDS